jgi:sigma-B regulation protein RsbU (phosphoserine phosphatase)
MKREITFRTRLAIACYLVLLIAVSSVEIARGVQRVRLLTDGQSIARPPFTINLADSTIEFVRPEAAAAGLQKGDRVTSIEGRPMESFADVAEAVVDEKPSRRLPVNVLRGGQELRVEVSLAPWLANEPRWVNVLIVVLLACVIPWSGMLLGFGVLALRPRDPLAWLLLLMMLSFGQVVGGELSRDVLMTWKPVPRTIGFFYHVFLATTWPLWMMLFGQFFPDRVSKGRWQRIFRVVLGLPVLVTAFAAAVFYAITVNDHRAIGYLEGPLTVVNSVTYWLGMAAIAVFFSNLGYKSATYPTPDGRRRLKLMYWGAFLGLTPIFILIVTAAIQRRPLSSMPEYFFLPALALLVFFPATMVYVIVVQRALDLRVVLRQGLQYALASRGVRVIQVILTISVILILFSHASDTSLRRVQRLQLASIAVVAIFLLQRVVLRLQGWLDRVFFREAVRTEEMLANLNANIRTIVEKETLLTTVTETIADTMHVAHVAALVSDGKGFVPAHTTGFQQTPPVTFSRESAVVERLQQAHEPLRVYWEDPNSWIYRDERLAAEKPLLEQLDAQLLLPLSVKDKMVGFLALGPKKNDEPYSSGDVKLLSSVATQTGLALENSRLTEAVAHEAAQREKLHRELEIASEVQQKLFPQTAPPVEGLDYHGYCRPALSVGGDYYDYFLTASGDLGICIGDVSGKGIPSALLMASLQAALRGMTLAQPPSMAELMSNLNKLIYTSSPSNKYATFFYGQYNPSERRLTYVNGGHNSPMVFRGGKWFTLDEGGPPVGLFGPARYQQGSVMLEPEDIVVCFTDGISECMNRQEKEFGEDRLAEVVLACRDLPAKEIVRRIISACDTFADGAPQHDDMTLVVIKVLPGQASEPQAARANGQ